MLNKPKGPLRPLPIPQPGAPLPAGTKKRSPRNRKTDAIIENILKAVIGIVIMLLVFWGIVRLMDSKKVPYLKISREAIEGDGKFTIGTEYGFVREAYLANGKKMSQADLKRLSEQPNPEFNIELVDATYPSQW